MGDNALLSVELVSRNRRSGERNDIKFPITIRKSFYWIEKSLEVPRRIMRRNPGMVMQLLGKGITLFFPDEIQDHKKDSMLSFLFIHGFDLWQCMEDL
ncbi:hypothetical protein TNCV_3432661 [Trichonephila clavipes]|nr:hypothetical protein TNCV_3432661 [Trichonephila clavipes]